MVLLGGVGFVARNIIPNSLALFETIKLNGILNQWHSHPPLHFKFIFRAHFEGYSIHFKYGPSKDLIDVGSLAGAIIFTWQLFLRNRILRVCGDYEIFFRRFDWLRCTCSIRTSISNCSCATKQTLLYSLHFIQPKFCLLFNRNLREVDCPVSESNVWLCQNMLGWSAHFVLYNTVCVYCLHSVCPSFVKSKVLRSIVSINFCSAFVQCVCVCMCVVCLMQEIN